MLFLVPQGQFQKHLHTLANIAKLLHKADFRQALEQAPDADAMLQIIRRSGQAISAWARPRLRDSQRRPASGTIHTFDKPFPVLPHKLIQDRLQAAVKGGAARRRHPARVLVRPCPDPKFGDYQTNALMGLAKARKLNPRQLADRRASRLDVGDVLRAGGNRRGGLSEFPAQAPRLWAGR